MLFNTLGFFAFFVCVLALYYRLAHSGQNRLLLIASYVFYGAWDWRFLGLLIFSTIATHYTARAFARLPEDSPRRTWLFWLGMVSNLGVLGFYKYYDFFVSSAATLLDSVGLHTHPTLLAIALPPGISFYTLQAVSYLVDVRGDVQKPARSLFDFALFHAYFPQLVAGPIERARHLLPQLTEPRTITLPMAGSAVQLICMGLVKKVVVADVVARMVRAGFDSPSEHSSAYLLVAVYLFALQIYCDFSGYSDIARGTSRLLGIELMVNFRQPYLARNITEFWERWHVSLSSWLRDYIFNPLSRGVRQRWRFHVNLLITMLAAGLWHGASWNYVVWGTLLGGALIGHKLIAGTKASKRPPRPRTTREWIRHLGGMAITFHIVCLSFILVCTRTVPGAWNYLKSISAFLPGSDWHMPLFKFIGYAVLVLALDLPCWWRDRELPLAPNARNWHRYLFCLVCVVMLVVLGKHEAAPFIYFQF